MRGARLCLILGLLAPLSPGRGEAITWVTSDPVYADAKETMSSGELAYLTAHLPHFTHRIVKVSAARAVHELQHGAGVCTPDLVVTPERESMFYFAGRRMGLPGFRLLIRKDKLSDFSPAIKDGKEVELAKLREIPGLTGSYTNSRHYGPAISDFIQAHGPDGLHGEVATFQVFNLIEAGRIDFAFVLPMDLYFYLPDEQRRRRMALVPIAGETPAIAATVACSKDPAGRALIRDIDALLADDAHWDQYVEPVRKWTSPEDFEAMRARH